MFSEPEEKILRDAQEEDLDSSESKGNNGTKTGDQSPALNEDELAEQVVEGVDVDEQLEGLKLQESFEVDEEVWFSVVSVVDSCTF